MKNTFLALTLLLGLSTLQATDMVSLSIQVQPSDARVRIMNIIPKFHNGMKLDKEKKYHLLINKKGYRTINQWIKLDGDKNFKFNLVNLPKVSLYEIFSVYSSRAKSYNYRQDVRSSSYMVDKSLIRKLGIALNLGDLKTVKKMIQAGVDVNIRFSSGVTPLHFAVARGRLDMVKYLVAQGADTSVMDKDYAVPAFVAVRTNPKIAEYLLSYERRFNNEKLEGKIQSAIISNDIKTFKKVFKSINVNMPMYGKKRALHSASQSGRYEMVKYLLEHGANVNQLDVAGISPLHEAIKSNSPKIVKLLVNHGAFVGVIDVFNRSSLSLYDENMKDSELKKYLMQKAKAEQVSMSIIRQENESEIRAFNKWLNS